MKNNFKCIVCGKEITKYVVHKSFHVCHDCYNKNKHLLK